MEDTLVNLIATGIIVLIGQEGRDWVYYGGDSEWWQVHLWLTTWWN